MILDKTSFFLNSDIKDATATCPWGTSIGQSKQRECRIDYDRNGILEVIVGMTYKSVSDPENVDISEGSSYREKLLCAKFDKVFINDKYLNDCSYVLTIVKEHSASHDNRLILSYAKYIKYNGKNINLQTINKIQSTICNTANGAWFIYELCIVNQDELHFKAIVLDKDNHITYKSSQERSNIWNDLIEKQKVTTHNFDEDALAKILKDSYNNARQGMQVAAIHAFGIRFGGVITNSASIIRKSGLRDSYGTELSKGINLYKVIRDKTFGLSFGNLEKILIDWKLNSESSVLNTKNPSHIASLQQIYYGAPGTGKSHATNEVTSKYPDTVRTTFHPDSDYSTFVGAYKPTMTKVRKAVVIGQDEKEVKPLDGNSEWEEKIAYKFVKQAFLKAYVKAWKKFAETCVEGGELAPQFLVIEEINRGNCAQIFGDLFQLLDRKQNFSEYPVDADADICKALLEEDTEDNPSFGADGLQLTDEQKAYINNVYNGKPVAEKICKGEVLVLPPNLYIWATMNTSDQSLFPIDSAFKRRWEWKYIKIKEGKDKDGNKLDWKIEIKGEDEQVKLTQDWWAFIQKINAIIASMTSSADKQLGYFFCKAAGDGVISAETFVSKVIFYLWNDVFKDYGFEDASLFRYKVKEGEKEVEKDLTFPDFYDEDGEKVDSERLVDFIQKVMDWQKPEDNA